MHERALRFVFRITPQSLNNHLIKIIMWKSPYKVLRFYLKMEECRWKSFLKLKIQLRNKTEIKTHNVKIAWFSIKLLNFLGPLLWYKVPINLISLDLFCEFKQNVKNVYHKTASENYANIIFIKLISFSKESKTLWLEG